MKNENYWKKLLSPKQYEILRNRATEPPFSGKYVKFNKDGIFCCVACGNKLFDSKAKFDSGCGWPSFRNARENAIKFRKDTSHGLHRTEVVCANCQSHLGHVFEDGPYPSGQRYCINSLALDFKEKNSK